MDANIFLQSQYWLYFQKAFGRRVFWLERRDFKAAVVEHVLPLAGGYFYVPRGPIASPEGEEFPINGQVKKGLQEMTDLAKKEGAGWIRIEPETEELLAVIKENMKEKIVKAPYDVQPRENFVIDIAKTKEQLLAEMKPKTRYNIRLAQKHGVSVQAISNFQLPISKQYADTFLKLTKEMARRQGIVPHPDDYYRKMMEVFPADMLKLYAAEHEGKVIAANLVLFCGDTATYLHGASSDEKRNIMAPFLLQWQAVSDAKEKGCKRYDFGGVKSRGASPVSSRRRGHGVASGKGNGWEGITNFKFGFAPQTKPTVFPGSYDIIINPRAYALYRGLQRAKMFLRKIQK